MCDFAHLNVYLATFWGVLKITYSQDARTDLDENTAKDAFLHKDVPFWGRKTKI